jgi:chromosome partitioning protein
VKFLNVITIFNQKGGVGKTTTNINLGSFLANEGYRVLTIDVDPQGNTTSGLGIDKTKLKGSVYDIITSDMSMKDIIIQSELISNFYIAPSNMELAGAEVELITTPNRESILKNKIQTMIIKKPIKDLT